MYDVPITSGSLCRFYCDRAVGWSVFIIRIVTAVVNVVDILANCICRWSKLFWDEISYFWQTTDPFLLLYNFNISWVRFTASAFRWNTNKFNANLLLLSIMVYYLCIFIILLPILRIIYMSLKLWPKSLSKHDIFYMFM